MVSAARDAPSCEPGGHARDVGRARGRVGEDGHPCASSSRRDAARVGRRRMVVRRDAAPSRVRDGQVVHRAGPRRRLPPDRLAELGLGRLPVARPRLRPDAVGLGSSRRARGSRDAVSRLSRVGCGGGLHATDRRARERHEPAAGVHLHRLRGRVLAQPLRAARPRAAGSDDVRPARCSGIERVPGEREREARRGHDARRGVADERDGVDDAHRRGEHPVEREAGRGSDLQLAAQRGLAVDHDPVGAVAFGGRPVRREVGRHAIDVFDHDRVASVDDADRLEAHRADGAGVDGSRRDLERPIRHPLLVGLADLAERDAELIGDELHRRTPRTGLHAGKFHQAAMVERLAETEDLEHRERDRVVLVAEDLLRADRANALRHRREREHEVIAGEAGLDAARVERRLAPPARGLDARDRGRVEPGRIQEPGNRRGHHVDAGLEDSAEVVDRLRWAGTRPTRRNRCNRARARALRRRRTWCAVPLHRCRRARRHRARPCRACAPTRRRARDPVDR